MAVPKKKTTPSRQGMRRAHHALGKINAIIDKKTGEYRLPHHVGIDGTYNDRQVLVNKKEEQSEEA